MNPGVPGSLLAALPDPFTPFHEVALPGCNNGDGLPSALPDADPVAFRAVSPFRPCPEDMLRLVSRGLSPAGAGEVEDSSRTGLYRLREGTGLRRLRGLEGELKPLVWPLLLIVPLAVLLTPTSDENCDAGEESIFGDDAVDVAGDCSG